MPSGPFITAPSAAEFVTIEKTTSDSPTTALGESAHFIPFLISHSAFERVRLYPVTLCPLLSSRFTISLPITPRPTNPNFAKPHLSRIARCQISFELFAGGIARIFPHLLQMRLHRIPRTRGIPMLDGFQNLLVVILPALRSAFHLENPNPLLAQQSDNRINQRKYDRIAGRLR